MRPVVTMAGAERHEGGREEAGLPENGAAHRYSAACRVAPCTWARRER